MEYPATNGGRLLRRGDTFDPECHRTTYRLQLGQRILAASGVEFHWDHGPNEGVVGTGLLQRTGHVCDYRCKAVWPAWATGEMFDRAYALADEVQTERGNWHQSKINEERRVREKREREERKPSWIYEN